MSNIFRTFLVLFVAMLFALPLLIPRQVDSKEFDSFPLPELSQTDSSAWLNSAPLKREDLLGKVTLIDFWTYGCWNCYRSFPWLHSVEEKFADKSFGVLGIHTPEFDHERKRLNVVKKIEEFNIAHPVMMDNDFGFWKAMNNHYWPSWYLVDKQGIVRYLFVGETHEGTRKAMAIEAAIEQLLSEE